MSTSIAYNMDCLDAMREMPDNAFDLAVVDPPYGDGLHAENGGGKGWFTKYNQAVNSQSVHVEREREAADVPPQSKRTAGMHSAWSDWPDEPGVDRVVDGIPNRVDRIKCLGNAVVPQQFYPFFAAIAEIERGKDNGIL